ncbi:RNA-binding protein 12B-like isoform 1-T1 [Leptodactylus fuscus]|uniref:RNA-binding protein 12B-like n=1 Tax=Leptodactylus fuscus TaxID=238119 RepID=UPI003F4E82F3
MVLTVRLRGLPPTADSDHIQSFFTGLKIEKEGVNIIGGEHGEAFVTFVDSNNVAQAVTMSGRNLLDCPIHISLNHDSSPGYVCISFRPIDATAHDIKAFFKTFSVEGVFFYKYKGVNSGSAIVKFGNARDAQTVLSMFSSKPRNSLKKISKEQNKFTVLCAKEAVEKTWISIGGFLAPAHEDKASKQVEESKNRVNPSSKWFPEMPPYKKDFSSIREFYAHIVNVSPSTSKSRIRKFLSNRVDNSQITLLYDKGGKRRTECLVMFITEEDYVQALMLDKSVLLGRRVRVMPVSKDNVIEMLERNRRAKERQVSEEEVEELDIRYFYLRNFAASVNRLDVLKFFDGFSVTEEDICMLYDDYGNSLGEALVKFSTKREAFMAEQLNHKQFQDTEILVRRISKEQVKAFGVDFFLDQYSTDWRHSTNMDVCGADVCVTEEDDPAEVTCDV